MTIVDKINSADYDTWDGKFTEADHALEKLFNSIPIDAPEYNNVRRSYLIRTWIRLAHLYEPTMNKILVYKNKALDDYRKTKNIESLKDFFCLAQRLKHDKEVIEVFIEVKEHDLSIANKTCLPVFKLLVENNEWQLLAETMTKNAMEHKYHSILKVFRYDPKIEMTKEQLQDKEKAQLEFITINLNHVFKVIATKRDDGIRDYFLQKAKMDLTELGLNNLYKQLAEITA